MAIATETRPSSVKPAAQATAPAPAAVKPATPADKAKRLAAIAPAVTAALDEMNGEAFAALQTSDRAPDVIREALACLPQPRRNDIALWEFSNNMYRYVVHAGIDLRLLDGNTNHWSMFSDLVKPFDSVRAISQDRSSFADFIITDCDDQYADARLIFYMKIPQRKLQDAPAWMPEGYKLERCGPDSEQSGWIIRRQHDGVVLTDGLPFKTIEDARRFIKDHPIFRRDEAVQYFPR